MKISYIIIYEIFIYECYLIYEYFIYECYFVYGIFIYEMLYEISVRAVPLKITFMVSPNKRNNLPSSSFGVSSSLSAAKIPNWTFCSFVLSYAVIVMALSLFGAKGFSTKLLPEISSRTKVNDDSPFLYFSSWATKWLIFSAASGSIIYVRRNAYNDLMNEVGRLLSD